MRHQARSAATAHAPAGAAPARRDDGWAAFSSVLGGALLYAGLGWLLDAWLGTRVFVGVGLLAGVVLGVYVVYARGFRTAGHTAGPAARRTGHGRQATRTSGGGT